MQRKFEELRENLEEFVQQTDYSLLVVGCEPTDSPYVAQFLSGLDASRPESFFLVFVEPFESPERYVEALVENLRQQLEGAAPVREESFDPPLPALPAELERPEPDAAARFQAFLRFLPRLLEDPQAQSLIVGLLPASSADAGGYARLLAGILPHPERPAWMEPLRIVASDPRDAPRLMPLLRQHQIETVLTTVVDFSTPALTDALGRDAANPSLPLPERMACLLQLAGLDFAYRRYPDALEKYTKLFAHYADPPQPAMQALCLQGAGDVLGAAGQPEEAKAMYQRGIALCIAERANAPLLLLELAVQRHCAELGQHAEAESYAQSGIALAANAVNPPIYTLLAEKKADAQRAQGKRDEARASYEHARTLAQTYEQFAVWRSVLDKLAEEHRAAGEGAAAREALSERARVDALERRRFGGESAPLPLSPIAAEAHG